VRKHVDALLGSDGFLALPSAPGPAPLLNSDPVELEAFRTKAFGLTSVSGLCGLPQVTIPLAKVDGLPVGLSLIGPRNSDEALLDLAHALSQALPVLR